jgi:uracil-DNA glycosylase
MPVKRRERPTAPGRIRGTAVPPLWPDDPTDRIRAILVGEAPGPRGADQSGIPFFGDRAGKPLYAAMRAAGVVQFSGDPVGVKWDGAALVAAGVRPVVSGIVLTNGFDRCPTDDGQHFRAPTRAERESPENLARLRTDIEAAIVRGADRICCLGKVAASVVRLVDPPITVHELPHPSAQGLLTSAPNRGRGARMADLEAAWIATLADLLRPR